MSQSEPGLSNEMKTEVLLNLRSRRLTQHLLQIVGVVALVASIVALTVSLVTFQREATASKVAAAHQVSEACGLYAQVGELQPSLTPPVTSPFALELVITMREKFTSLGCKGTLPASNALIVLAKRYHLKLEG
jgi:hypothetical protein